MYLICFILCNFSENAGYTTVQTFVGHSNYVVSVIILNKSNILPNGLIVTGGNDKLLCGFVPESPEPVFIETRHTNTGKKTLIFFLQYFLFFIMSNICLMIGSNNYKLQ